MSNQFISDEIRSSADYYIFSEGQTQDAQNINADLKLSEGKGIINYSFAPSALAFLVVGVIVGAITGLISIFFGATVFGFLLAYSLSGALSVLLLALFFHKLHAETGL